MTSTDVSERPGLFARVRGILFHPQSEWRRIAGEDPAPLIGPYVVPLVASGALISFAAAVGYGGGFVINAALISKALSAALYVAFAVLGVLAAALLINWLAPRFGAEANPEHAKRLAAYAATPIFVSMFAAIAPPIAGGVIAAGVIYAFVLLALGMQPLMPLRDPENNVPRFTILFVALAALASALAATFAGPLIQSGHDALTGAVETIAPAPPVVDMPRRSGAEVAIERLSQADATLVLADPALIETQFPDSLPGGFERQSAVTAQGGGVSRADAVYREGSATFSVAIIQFSANVDPAAFATLLNVKPDGSRDDGYDRSQTIDGRFFAEEVRASSSRYIVIGRGVVMIAEGGVTMDQARAAVETIGLQRLEAMFGR